VRADLARQLEGAKRTISAVADGDETDVKLRELVAHAGTEIDKYLKQADGALDMASVDPNTGVAAMQTADGSFASLAQSTALIVKRIDELTADTSATAVASSVRTCVLFGALGLLAALAAVGGSWLMQRRLVADLGEAGRITERVAAGVLDAVPASTRADELGDVLRGLAHMSSTLADSLRTVRDSTLSIHTASHEIASGNNDLSSRTEQAASSLQQTASSMEQLTGTVTQSADAARQANQLAGSAAEVARRGGAVVSQVVATMDEINTSSKKIADIIGVIDGIAFQTNILALNAAVEAARAGEQGRGLPSSPAKCAAWRNARPMRPRKSSRSSAAASTRSRSARAWWPTRAAR